MSARWKTLYIVTPDSNVATFKRLRGIGIATGITINPVMHPRDLPSPPHENSILLIPSHMLSGEVSLACWANVFVICKEGNEHTLIKHNKIIIPNNLDLPTAWLEVTSLLVRHIIKTSDELYWHSVRHTIFGNTSNSAIDLFEWLKNFKYSNKRILESITKTFENITTLNTHQLQENIETKISIDCQKFHLNIRVYNTLSLTAADTSLVINSLQDCPEVILTTHNGLHIYTSFNLTTKKHPRFIFVINEAVGHDILRRTSREAS